MAKESKNVEKTPEQAVQDKIRADHEYVIRNKRVRRQSRRRAFMAILLVFLIIIALLSGATYAVMHFVDESNVRVTVTQTGTAYLSLADNLALNDPTSVLNVSAPKNLNAATLFNGAGHSPDLAELVTDIAKTDGDYTGEGADQYYIASTFYLTNPGKEAMLYEETITLERALREMDKAIRVMLIRDETPAETTDLGSVMVFGAYATNSNGEYLLDGNGNKIREEVVPTMGYKPQSTEHYTGITFDPNDFTEDGIWLARPFTEEGYIYRSEPRTLEKDQIVKYTVLVWLEGWDPQCVGSSLSTSDAERGILGGQVKLSVIFNALEK